MRTTLSMLGAAVLLGSCAHTKPDAMTADEHRLEAAQHERAAMKEEAKFDPAARQTVATGRSPFTSGPAAGSDGAVPPSTWAVINPTESHLEAAARQHQASRAHQDSAALLEKFEDAACKGIPGPARTACPLLRPMVTRVEELSGGVRMTFKERVDVDALYQLMLCHLAFSTAKGFDAAECPLYVKGVKLVRPTPMVIEAVADSPAIGARIRTQARMLFSPPQS